MVMTQSEAGRLGGIAAREASRLRGEKFRSKYLSSPKACRGCGVELSYEKRMNDFCGRSCRARYCNPIRITTRTHIKRPCKICGGISKYDCCSHKCNYEYRKREYIRKWLSGEISGSQKNASIYIREWISLQHGEVCWMCGWDEKNPITNKVPVQLDHVDGNALNNRPDNLRLLCPNCHSLTPTFSGLNRGHGRSWRYKTGKEVKIPLV